MRRREFLGVLGGAAAGCCLPSTVVPSAAAANPSPATTPLYWSWWAWEPIDAYHRTNRVSGAVDGTAPWMGQWWDRIHSEELVRMMAGLGVNLAVTHFFKGYGLRHEHGTPPPPEGSPARPRSDSHPNLPLF